MTAAAVTSTATVEASATMEPSAAEARPPAEGVRPRNTAVIKTAERPRVCTGLAMPGKTVLGSSESSPRRSTMKSAAAIEVVAVHEDSAVGYVSVVVELNPVPTAPIVAPVVPAPAISAKQTDSKADAKPNSWAGKEQSRI
jgi:hypothetical protein